MEVMKKPTIQVKYFQDTGKAAYRVGIEGVRNKFLLFDRAELEALREEIKRATGGNIIDSNR